MIYGRPDPQDAPAFMYCAHCGGEIYNGETAYDVPEFGIVCCDCIKDWKTTVGDTYGY